MNSMTGFGRGEASAGGISLTVEIKTVNNRFLDLNLRLPREYNVLEPRIRSQLKSALYRGRVELFMRRLAEDSGHDVHYDPALAERYLRAMGEVAKRLQRTGDAIPFELVLAQPGVLTPVESQADGVTEWSIVSTALEAALADLLRMRATEGEELRADLARNLDEMLRLSDQVEAAAEGIAERLRERLDARLEKLLGEKIDATRLAQEAAVLADKADVSEELARIKSHCLQFAEALAANEPVGRKLDFLVQELNREINTVGSKAAEHPISSTVVDLKSVLERLREQAANVE